MAFLLTFSGGGSATYKDAVRAASTASVPLTGSTPLVIDGVTLADKERVLLKDQSPASGNGIYEVAISGGSYTLSRAKDADTDKEVLPGMLVPIAEGTLYADKIYQLLTNAPIVVGVTALNFQLALLPINLTTDVTGVLPTANGGTNRASWSQGRVVFVDAGGGALTEDSDLNWDNSNKRLGIGTASPNAKVQINNSGTQVGLSVYSTSTNNALQFFNQGTTSYTAAFYNSADSAQTGASIGGYFSRGTLGARTQSLANDVLLSLTGSGYTGSVFAPGVSGGIVVAADQNTTAGGFGGQVSIVTTPNNTLGLPLPRLTVKNDGKVGINTLLPSEQLDVSGNIKANALKLNGASSGVLTLNAADATVNYTVKMPDAQGAASTFLKNDGSGNLSWDVVDLSNLANKTLSNLTAPTAINQDLSFNKATAAILSGSDAKATQANHDLTIRAGNTGSAVAGGNLYLLSGESSTASGGNIYLRNLGSTVSGRGIYFRGYGSTDHVVLDNNGGYLGTSFRLDVSLGFITDNTHDIGSINLGLGQRPRYVLAGTGVYAGLPAGTGVISGSKNFDGSSYAPGSLEVSGGDSTGNTGTVGGDSAAGSLTLRGGDQVAANAVNAGSTTLRGGNKTAGTGNGGNVTISGGTSVGGTAGSIIVNTAATERLRITDAGEVKLSGGLSIKSRHMQTGTVTVAVTDTYIGCDTALAVTVNLPSGATAGAGKLYVIKDENGSAATWPVTINANGTDLIDGAGSYSLAVNREAITLICDGTDWHII